MKVLLFARLRDLLGADQIAIDDVGSVGELRRQLMQRHPQAAAFIEKCAVAVNDEFADDRAPIPKGADVALLPPVSGG
jgi:molybdopterin converting factor subunit 1